MIKVLWVKLFFGLFLSTKLTACPTCVGRITHDSPLFFSEEFYNTHTLQVFDQKNATQQQVMMVDIQGERKYE